MTSKLGVIVGATRYSDPETKEVRFCLDLLDLDRKDKEPERVPIDFLGHGFALHPRRRHEAALLEKRGPGACYVDLHAREVLRTIAPMPGHHFYGHGAFSRDGDVLFAIETELATNGGAVSIRADETFEVLETFPTYGMAPHDCVLIEDGKTLAITNGGGPIDAKDAESLPCVTFVDVASRKLLEKLEVDNPRINTGHIALTKNREFAVVSAPRDGLPQGTSLGGVTLRAAGKRWRHMTEPKNVVERFLGESLSVCIHEPTRTVLATHPYGHLITFWSLDAGKLLAALDLAHARGVTLTLDGRYYAVSFGPEASLLLIETQPLKVLRDADHGTRRFGGSHIYTWERAVPVA